MTNIIANVAQVITNSPTVTSLVAADAAATETAKRQAQVETSQKFQETLQKTVLAPEQSAQTREHNEAELKKTRLEDKRKKKSVARRARRKNNEALLDQNSDCAPSRDPWAVIDICV